MSGGVCERHEKEARNIAQQYAIFSWKTSAGLWRWCNVKSTSLSLAKNVFWRQNYSWRWAAQQMTISNAERWQHSTGKRTCSIWLKINSQIDCWWSEHEPGNHLFDTEWRIGDEKNLCQNGAQESHRATADWAQFLTSKCITVRLQPAYSPNLAPCDFFLFQKVKLAVKGQHFESTEDIQRAVTQVLNDVPQNAFQECYKEWQHRWKRCVQAQGMYFEGDHIVVDE